MRLIEVELPPQCGGVTSWPATQDEKKARKDLMRLRPVEYLHAASNPKFGLVTRAVLQSMKDQFMSCFDLMHAAQNELKSGQPCTAQRALHSLRHRLKGKVRQWSIYDHLISRFVHWAIRQVKLTASALRNLGLTAQDLRYALPKRNVRHTSQREDCRLFVVDVEFTTGAPIAEFPNWGEPASIPAPLGQGSRLS
jgi:hypothetical protein